MSERATQVGISQRVRLEWLEKTANLVLAGNEKTAIEDALQEMLVDRISIGGSSVRGNREKTITILMKTWFNVPCGLEELRDEGLDLLRFASPGERVAIHWGMTLAAYPFWGAVAARTGKLLGLQGTLTAAAVQRRIREAYGERETVARATRRVLRSFVDWEVLSDMPARGVYARGQHHSIVADQTVAWILEAVVRHRSGSASPRDLLNDTALFPFRLAQLSSAQLAHYAPRLEVHRHALDAEFVTLRGVRAGN